MTASARTIVATLLCGIACVGHVPAWWHHRSCDHRAGAPLASFGNSFAEDGADCCHGDLPEAHATVTSGSPRDSHPHPSDGHEDSDSCAMCHLLAAPNGVAWQVESTPVGTRSIGYVSIGRPLSPEAWPLAIHHTRGPPLPIA